MKLWLLIIPTAYLLGSIPFGYLLVRTFLKQDIRAVGSGNIGATNVARSGAKGLGILTLLLDCLKGFAAVILALYLAQHDLDLAALAAVAAILGHVFPIWLGFRGGKGIATALGVFLALSWPTALCALGVFIAITLLTRYVSLGSILGAATLPLFMLYFQPYHSLIFVSSTIFISLLCILKHSANIVRLKNGTESKIGSTKAAEAEASLP
ncbi:MAG: glycerol-3-phosphate 1-O-acyltransferase PlsY [Acidobacteriota bacterium]|nr:glycerol-3-phosphate 1-O-acyltransferase PlsY [Acidobacteriota bacterium]